MEQFDIKALLTTRGAGPLRLGMQRGELEAVLGSPLDWLANQPVQRSEIWRYGSIEFHFTRPGDRLWMIFSDHFVPFEGWPGMPFEPWIIRADLTLAEAERLLAAEQITFTVKQQPWEITDLRITTGGSLSFAHDDATQTWRLSSFNLSDSSLQEAAPTKRKT